MALVNRSDWRSLLPGNRYRNPGPRGSWRGSAGGPPRHTRCSLREPATGRRFPVGSHRRTRVKTMSEANTAEWIKKAELLEREGDVQGAKAIYRQVIAETNAPVSAYVNLGNTLKNEGKFERAIAVLKEAVETRPNHPNLYVRIADIYHQQGRLEQAEETYAAALQIDPKLPSALAGLVALKKKRDRLAEQSGEPKSGKAPRWKEREKIAEINGFLGRDKVKAIELYQAAVASDPGIRQRIIQQYPRPLFCDNPPLALFFVPKSGCTFAIKWFFCQAAVLEDALSHHWFAHQYRREVFNKTVDASRIIQDFLGGREISIVKVVRNPYMRAVSSYIHAVKTGYEDERIGEFLGRSIINTDTFSFREFAFYLEGSSLRRCDPHHGVQIHMSEELGLVRPRYVVKLESSFDELRRVEVELGLRETDLKALADSPHHAKKEETSEWCGDKRYIRSATTSFPQTINFYDKELQEKVAELYRVDFEAYGYDADKFPL